MHVVLVGAEIEENLAIRHLASTLLSYGHRVGIVRFDTPNDIEPAARAVVESGAPLVGMSMVFTHRAREFVALADRVRELGFGGHITAGGHFAAFNATALLERGGAIDSIVVGEGELVLVELAQALAGRSSDTNESGLQGVFGLVFRGTHGVVHNPRADKVADLDRLPPPVRRPPFHDYLGLPIANLLSSRGCAHACAFCSIAAWHKLCGGPRYRTRRVELVADEMASLYAQGVRIFNFQDDHFLLETEGESLDRIQALQQAIAARGIGRIAIAIKARPDRIRDAILEALVPMGLLRVFVGIEAGTEAALRQLGRGQHLADNERALALLREHELHAAYNLLVFNPDSTIDDVMENAAFLASHADFPTNFCRAEVYAGTPLEARLRKRGQLRGDYWGYDYRISDPHAQALFEVVRVAFYHRNFEPTGAHQRAMRVDYERQVLEHFWGRTIALHRRAKRLIHDINVNTAEHLSWAAERIRAVGPEGASTACSELTDRVAKDDLVLEARAGRVISEIASSARRPLSRSVSCASTAPEASPGAPRALARGLAYGVAASLALTAGSGCGGQYTESDDPNGNAGAGSPHASAGGHAGKATGGTHYYEPVAPSLGGAGNGQGGAGGTHYYEPVVPSLGGAGNGQGGAGGTHYYEPVVPSLGGNRSDAGVGGRQSGGAGGAGGTHYYEPAAPPLGGNKSDGGSGGTRLDASQDVPDGNTPDHGDGSMGD